MVPLWLKYGDNLDKQKRTEGISSKETSGNRNRSSRNVWEDENENFLNIYYVTDTELMSYFSILFNSQEIQQPNK